jgi:DNA polymerase alpha subunit A
VSTKKSNRLDALERLKNVRTGGAKNKYEVRELENVYDVVDESTYSRKVHDRQRDDWIVDDGKDVKKDVQHS